MGYLKVIFSSILIGITSTNNAFAQFGEFGEFEIGIASLEYHYYISDQIQGENIGQASSAVSGIYANYNRYFPLDLNFYFFAGIGYGYNPYSWEDIGPGIPDYIVENQKHFASIPIGITFMFAELGSGKREDEILTSYQTRLKYNFGADLRIRLNTLLALGKNSTTFFNEEEVNPDSFSRLMAQNVALADNFNGLVFIPDATVSLTIDWFTLRAGITIPFINHFFKTETIQYTYELENGTQQDATIEFSQEFENFATRKIGLVMAFGFDLNSM
ncbi:hypothetical protein [Marinirhabdus gelatinilytica]|uniref:Outer membrane protein with beta-barrel domain n=1 Tax=Marinirhabdus gelatinilytica TaxID=1703343 RepID=A0A370QG59_9FLAO|nr:hypothetical protein [Marinirhabdus gelatinilytica]RDK87279.1 hypothetical protein C8D94_102464 [Marinirhabdus gelatinilytica]